MWQVIDSLYGQNIGCDKTLGALDTISEVFKIEQKLVEWERNLPPTLQLIDSMQTSSDNSTMQQDPLVKRFSIILTLRFLNLRILLHRPVLVAFLDNCNNHNEDRQELMILQQVAGNMISICVNSSIDVITIIHGVVTASDPQYELLGAWWFSLYYCRSELASLRN